jgi:poly(3-hydroxybutyrate) depolymerase
MKRLFYVTALIGLIVAIRPSLAQNRSTASLFEKFWIASNPIDAEKAAGEIANSGVAFDEVFRRLKAGRTYAAKPSGVVMLNNKTHDGFEHYFAVNVPVNYDPTKRYQLRFQLHGGVGGRQTNQPRGNGEIGNLAGPAEQFYVLPYSWHEAPWWSNDQVLNFDAMIDALKRAYNIDENRIVLAGVSDGGTGAYYLAMRDTTPFASFAPLNGFIMVLGNPEIEDGNIFPMNLRNKPMFVVNGGRDPLYPIAEVEPYVKHLSSNGVQIAYYPQLEAAHNTSWWPELKGTFEQFVTDHPRDPDPDTLVWETADLSHNRAHWLVIDKLGDQPTDPEELNDMNVLIPETMSDFSHPMQLFERPRRPGLVELHRKGNLIEATTKGVSAFTLLLSPDKIDFSKPVKVVVNGHETFNGRVEKNLETLLKWAARDNDRTMLYAAELKIKFGH